MAEGVVACARRGGRRWRRVLSVAAADIVLAGAPGASAAAAQEPRPKDSVEERQLQRVTDLLRALIRAEEEVLVERGGFEGNPRRLPGISLPDSSEVRLVLRESGYDLRVGIEEHPFVCRFERRMRLTPDDPDHLGRIRCRRIERDEEPSGGSGATPRGRGDAAAGADARARTPDLPG